MRIILTVLVLLELLLVTASSLHAAGPTLSTDLPNTPLIIRGFHDAQTTTFSGNLRLTVTGGDATELILLASDLPLASDRNIVIDRSNVTIPSGIGFQDGQTRDVRVTVGNVTRPGDYRGELRLLLPDQPLANALVIPIELHIAARPQVRPTDASLTIQVVHCQIPGDCLLTPWLMSQSFERNTWTLNLDNQTLVPVRLTDARPVLRGDISGAAIDPDAIQLTAPLTLTANQVTPISMTLQRYLLMPDRYQGMLRFSVASSDTPVTVGTTINVRSGPLGALLAIILGIIFGRLVRSQETPQARKQVNLLPRWLDLRARAMAVSDRVAADYLAERLQVIKSKIDSAGDAEEAVAKELADLDAQVAALISLDQLERDLQSGTSDALKAALLPKIRDARRAIIENRMEDAERLRQEIEATLHQAQQDRAMGPMADRIADMMTRVRGLGAWLAALKPTGPVLAPAVTGWRRFVRWFKEGLARLVAFLAGMPTINAEVRFWLIRPLLWLLLLVLLTLIGFQTLYVNGAPTFGANGLADYLGLFLWGLSAEVAQRTLQNLPAVTK